MSDEIDKIACEIVAKLVKYNSHIDWLETDRKKKEELLNLKLKEDSENAIAPENTTDSTPNIKELSPEEFSEQYAKDGQTFLTQRINEVAKFYPEKRAIEVDPERLEMLKQFRAGIPTQKIIEQFST